MEVPSGAYFDPDFDSLLDRNVQPRVCIDNDTSEAYTLVKVDSANRHGILLEMVQLLTDIDLVISKSYISSDGGWLMDVFHVTDQLGNKLTDPSLIRYIHQSLVAERKGAGRAPEAMTCLGKLVGPGHLASEYTALEVTATDQPGLLSEISAVLAELNCYVVSCQAWTHNRRSAVIMYIAEESTGKPISDPDRLAHVEEQVGSVVGAHLGEEDKLWRVRLSGPDPGRIHTERRLHQLMHEDRDYEVGPSPRPVEGDQFSTRTAVIEARKRGGSSSLALETQVSVDSWKEREYSIVNVRSRDRPKLLFDTVCTLTDMQYLVFHAAVSSHGPLAIQEYYIRHMDGRTFLDSENERRRVTRCLVAAVERRVSHGLRVEVSTRNRKGLLSDVTQVLREGGLSLTRAECTVRGERAMGTFYVTDASSSSGGGDVDPERMELVRKELGEGVTMEVSSSRPGWPPVKKVVGCDSGSNMSQMAAVEAATGRSIISSRIEEERPKVSLGSLLWSHIGRFSSNFGSIRS